MKPKKKHIIVKAFLAQKESHIVKCADGTSIELYLGRKYGENSREINPVVCEVTHKAEDVNQVDVGDLLIVHHNTLVNEATVIKKDYSEQSVIMPILADNMLYAKINKETGNLTPLYGNCIAERIDVVRKSIIIAPEQKKEEIKFKILATPADYNDVAVGDNVICYKLSDYEMVYNFKGSEKRAIRIWKDDILAVYDKV